MLEDSIDRTNAVENRIKGIQIKSNDACYFFEKRAAALVNIKQCWYCKYSKFDVEHGDIYQTGLCEFKK